MLNLPLDLTIFLIFLQPTGSHFVIHKEYDMLSICISHIHKMFKIREELLDNVTVSN